VTLPISDDGYPGFARCIEMVLSRNHLTFEDGFHWLMGHDEGSRLHGRAGELITLMPEHSDAYTRGKIIELLGYTARFEAISCWFRNCSIPTLAFGNGRF
jgi:hypothetical protein